jgi:hypothetical protein
MLAGAFLFLVATRKGRAVITHGGTAVTVIESAMVIFFGWPPLQVHSQTFGYFFNQARGINLTLLTANL